METCGFSIPLRVFFWERYSPKLCSGTIRAAKSKVCCLHPFFKVVLALTDRRPYGSYKKYCLIFTFKPPLVHLELQNTPQTLSGCITREYYRFWEFQHDRSTRTGLTVIKLHLLDFAPEPREIFAILSCNPLDPLKSRRINFITVSPVLVLRLCWNSQKR